MSIETIYSQDIEFEASVSLESNRLPDPYHYFFKNGKLYSPVTNEPVENSITINSPLDELESQAFQKIQKWFVEAENGMVIWISPPHQNRPGGDAKIIFADIVYGIKLEKQLRNRSVCLGLNANECLTFAGRLGFSNIMSSEELRDSPIFLNLTRADEFIGILEEYGQEQVKIIKTGEDFAIKERLKAKIAAGYSAPIGPYGGSCGPMFNSAFNIMFGNSLNISETSFDCPKCHRAIPSGRGITTCPHCGAKKEDYNLGCD